MGDVEKAAVTALFAILVLMIGQILQKWIMEPLQEQRKLIGEIAFALVFYANFSEVKPKEELETAQREIRSLASKFRATLWTIPFYGLFALFKIVPKRKDVLSASSGLIGMSNSLRERGRMEHLNQISHALGIDWKA